MESELYIVAALLTVAFVFMIFMAYDLKTRWIPERAKDPEIKAQFAAKALKGL